ncbi:MAG TPA: hypothetical protein VK172_14655 [Lentimicrobium sp.]|nr:hypothetical protein [Lentimicrobium sp.]
MTFRFGNYISVLPVGLSQAVASVQHGLWYARSIEFMQQPYIHTFKWMRVIGDTVFALGVVALVYFVFGLATGWSYKDHRGVSSKLRQ